MVNNEYEMQIEYSEMTAFNFNSKEYQEVKKDFLDCKERATGFEWIVKNFINKFKKTEAI